VKISLCFLLSLPSVDNRPLKAISHLGLLSICLGLGAAHAQEGEIGLIDSIHSRAGERLSDFVGQIDEFFGGEEESARANQSWARLRFDTKHQEKDDVELKAKLKLKLVLPSAERRFRLLFSTDDVEESKANDDVPKPANEADSNVSFALRFIRKARENSSVKFDLGLRSRDGKRQTFVRMGAFYRSALDEDWTGTATNNIYYYYSSRFENKLSFKFERALGNSKDWIFQSATQFGWKKRQKGAFIDQVAGIYRAFGTKSSLALEFLMTNHTSPMVGDSRFQGSALQVRYRVNVWRPWLYLEVWPSISWPIENQYRGLYGGLIRVEALIGRSSKVKLARC